MTKNGTNAAVTKLVQDALKVRDYPLDMQEGFLTLIIQQAITYGHTDCIDRLKANGVLGVSRPDAARRGFIR